jgi:hypothetical protein
VITRRVRSSKAGDAESASLSCTDSSHHGHCHHAPHDNRG